MGDLLNFVAQEDKESIVHARETNKEDEGRQSAEKRGEGVEEKGADAQFNDNHDHDHGHDASSGQGNENVQSGGGGGGGGGDGRRVVLGVAPPGLGVGIFSGLSNQQQCLVGLVLLASKQAGNINNNSGATNGQFLAPISLQSLRWRTTFESEDASAFVASELLWDLSVWRTLAQQGKLPEIVDAPPTKR